MKCPDETCPVGSAIRFQNPLITVLSTSAVIGAGCALATGSAVAGIGAAGLIMAVLTFCQENIAARVAEVSE